jgi:hypothetical protein
VARRGLVRVHARRERVNLNGRDRRKRLAISSLLNAHTLIGPASAICRPCGYQSGDFPHSPVNACSAMLAAPARHDRPSTEPVGWFLHSVTSQKDESFTHPPQDSLGRFTGRPVQLRRHFASDACRPRPATGWLSGRKKCSERASVCVRSSALRRGGYSRSVGRSVAIDWYPDAPGSPRL